MVVVCSESIVVGVVSERELAGAIGDGVDESSPVSDLMVAAPMMRTYATGAEALRELESSASSVIVVVDDENRLVGLVSPSDLFPRKLNPPRPSPVGGMATPFGVYLTNGAISGGVGNFALMSTGALLFLMITVSTWACLPLAYWLVDSGAPDWATAGSLRVLPIVLFLGLMRLIPLSGTHAAEHMVVHAIERGEELNPDIVRRMPRVHPRCGTNLAVGAMLFMGIFFSGFIENQELRFIAAVLATFLFWRRIGSLVQYWITTKPPKERQIRSGLKAGNELLDHFARSRVTAPSIPLRLWRSGMLQVMLGSFACFGFVYLVAWAVDHFWNLTLPT